MFLFYFFCFLLILRISSHALLSLPFCALFDVAAVWRFIFGIWVVVLLIISETRGSKASHFFIIRILHNQHAILPVDVSSVRLNIFAHTDDIEQDTSFCGWNEKKLWNTSSPPKLICSTDSELRISIKIHTSTKRGIFYWIKEKY